MLRESPRRFVVFCDDLSFEREDQDYKALKSVLDGGIEGRPANVLFYANKRVGGDITDYAAIKLLKVAVS